MALDDVVARAILTRLDTDRRSVSTPTPRRPAKQGDAPHHTHPSERGGRTRKGLPASKLPVYELLQVMSLLHVTPLLQELPVLKVAEVLKEVEALFLLSFSSSTTQRTPP